MIQNIWEKVQYWKVKKGKIKIKFQCINEGVLEIRLRGKDVGDKNGKRFPIYVDLTKVLINNDIILK